MSRNRILAGVCNLLLALAQTSCVVESINPLSDPDDAKMDERLFGQWKVINKEKDRDTEFWFVGRPRVSEIKDAPAGLMVNYGLVISPQNEVSSNGMPSYFFVTKLGKNHYVNIATLEEPKEPKGPIVWKKSEVKGYLLMKYTVTESKLTMWMMDRELTAKAVDAGKLKGIVRRNKDKDGKETTVESVTLKDSTADLAKFIDAANPSLFAEKEPIVLERVKW